MHVSNSYRRITGHPVAAMTVVALLAAMVLLASACGDDPTATPDPTATSVEQQQQPSTGAATETGQTDAGAPTSEARLAHRPAAHGGNPARIRRSHRLRRSQGWLPTALLRPQLVGITGLDQH